MHEVFLASCLRDPRLTTTVALIHKFREGLQASGSEVTSSSKITQGYSAVYSTIYITALCKTFPITLFYEHKHGRLLPQFESKYSNID